MKTKNLSIANVNFEDPDELARFREQQDALLTERKRKIIAELKGNGQLDDKGNFVFKQPLPDDMKPESLADFKH